MANPSSKKYTEKDFDELSVQIRSLTSVSDAKERYQLREKLLPVLAFLYQEFPVRWHDEYSVLLMQTSLEPEVTADEFEKYDRLDLALLLLGEHTNDGEAFFGLLRLLSNRFHSDRNVRSRRMIELYERHIDTAEQWQKKFSKRWYGDYLEILNEFATLYIEESQFDRAFIQLKKYFEIFDPKLFDEMDDFVYPWVRLYQSAVNSNNEDKSFLDHVSAKHIAFYKKALDAGYVDKVNQLLSEYQTQVVKNSGEPLLRERCRLFKKTFIVDDLLGV